MKRASKPEETQLHPAPRDKNGKAVQLGSRVRVLSLSGDWLDDLSIEDQQDVLSMVGEIFEVTELDEYGHPGITKWWRDEIAETSRSHSVALDSQEIELVDD